MHENLLQLNELYEKTTSSAQKSVTYIMNECIAIEVQSRFSIKGSTEKRSFYELNFRRAVTGV